MNQEQQSRDTTARDAALAAIVTRSQGKLTNDRAAELLQRSMNKTDFAASWAEVAPGMRAWGLLWDATYLLQSIFSEIRWVTEDAVEQAALISKATTDYSAAITEIMAELAASNAEVEARSGKKISAARMEKIKAAQTRASEVSTTLSDLITEVESESEATIEHKSGDKSPNVEMELHKRIATLEEKLAAQQAVESDLKSAQRDLDDARKRIVDLETRSLPARSREPETEARSTPQPQRRWSTGVLFGSIKTVGDSTGED